MNQYDLTGRVAVVTGGAQGIGFAVARRMAASGAHIAIWDRDGELAEQAAQSLGPQARAYRVDVTDGAAMLAAAQAVRAAQGSIGVLGS